MQLEHSALPQEWAFAGIVGPSSTLHGIRVQVSSGPRPSTCDWARQCRLGSLLGSRCHPGCCFSRQPP